MTTDHKKALLGFGLGALLLWGIVKLFMEKKEPEQPEVSQANIDAAVMAYQLAVQEGTDNATLVALNDALAKEFGVRVGLRSDGRYTVTNLSGKKIREV